MSEELKKEIAELRASITFLEQQVDALSDINTVLAVRLGEMDGDKNRTLALLDAMRVYKHFMDTELQAAEEILSFRRKISLMLEAGDPLTVLIVGALQGKDAGADRLSALREWQNQATPDELADDVREALRKFAAP